ncbi:MAG TPA: hypothetical protein VML55_10825 [Planctomycetaceae bacterium]|nr:hypothetical protein [Planctomycetaceae bacterium]
MACQDLAGSLPLLEDAGLRVSAQTFGVRLGLFAQPPGFGVQIVTSRTIRACGI